MPEWVHERGIGETRCALVDREAIVEARVVLDGTLAAGSVVDARLTSVGTNGRNALAVAQDGTELLLPHRPAGVSEGGALHLEITREAIASVERWKRPLARVTDAAPQSAPLPGRLARPGELAAADWDEIVEQAQSGSVSFPGGSLGLFATPAMTLIDVDGHLPPGELAVAGARAAAQAIRRLGIGGSIGIDLPTVAGKAPRAASAEAIDAVLTGTRFERTAVNGFGFLQLVRPRRHASLLELALDRPAFAARQLLRQAASAHGPATLVAAPAVVSLLEAQQSWLEQLARARGGAIALRADPGLAIWAGHAED
ncbi:MULTISPECIES: ribonuclease [Sphingomonas]|uniref:ribonuclease n=1 Tax=Sphingomonas TaxID=13687 RepID=UPI000DEFCAF8|nr:MULTISPECIES: ribonuclease [Sphingomonas]